MPFSIALDIYSQVSNKQAGWNKDTGRGKFWKVNKQAGSNNQSGWGKNLKMNKYAGSITLSSCHHILIQ